MTQLFDALLAVGIVGVAVAALFAKDRFAAVGAFMVMGFLVALSWVRLGAPDVALAEAAIGAGLTGALLLRSARRLQVEPKMCQSRWSVAASGLISIGFAGLLYAAITSVPTVPAYPPLVAERLGESGVSNPVTAVLLNFRAWDTLLEIAVLFVALVLVIVVPVSRVRPAPLGEMVMPFAKVVVPLSVLISGHLLWQGADAPGGAFQAGAVLAGGGLALVLAGAMRLKKPLQAGILRATALSGLAVFGAAAVATAALTGHLLGYPDGQAKIWILGIEAVLTLAIAATLVLLFHGSVRRVPK